MQSGTIRQGRASRRSLLLSARCWLLLPLTAALVAGCGASSTKSTKLTADTTAVHAAKVLVSQSVTGQRKVTSGNLSFGVTITPSGSSVITAPIAFSISGPFSTAGNGQLGSLDLTLSGSAQGQHGTLQVIAVNGKAYVTLDGKSYAIPAATLTKFKAAMSSKRQSRNQKAGQKLLSKLGIDFNNWLSKPSVVGTADVDGAQTTHIHATVNVAGILADVDKLLGSFNGSSSSSALRGLGMVPNSISPAVRTEIEKELGTPTFDSWTGTSDKILRRLRISATLPVSGKISTELGGLSSAAIKFSYDLSDVNQPQTITAPTTVIPFAQLETKLKSLTQSIGSQLLGGELLQGANGAGSISGFGAGSGIPKKYTECIQKAGGDASKLQQCASALSS